MACKSLPHCYFVFQGEQSSPSVPSRLPCFCKRRRMSTPSVAVSAVGHLGTSASTHRHERGANSKMRPVAAAVVAAVMFAHVAAGPLQSFGVTMTGDVAADFPVPHPGVFEIVDTNPPILFIGGPTGWDIQSVRFAYDASSDTAYFGACCSSAWGDLPAIARVRQAQGCTRRHTVRRFHTPLLCWFRFSTRAACVVRLQWLSPAAGLLDLSGC